VLELLTKTGPDLSRSATVKHFCSWLGLCPGTKISGGKALPSGTKRAANRTRQALKLAAQSLWHSRSALRAFYRRMQSRMDRANANTATAHKLARLFHFMLAGGLAGRATTLVEGVTGGGGSRAGGGSGSGSGSGKASRSIEEIKQCRQQRCTLRVVVRAVVQFAHQHDLGAAHAIQHGRRRQAFAPGRCHDGPADLVARQRAAAQRKTGPQREQRAATRDRREPQCRGLEPGAERGLHAAPGR
jgi:hypothetical protein